MYSRKVKMLCLAMAVVFPATMLMADTRAAMAYSSGAAIVNGAAMGRTSAVFSGDSIETAANSTVTLNASGATVIIPGNSQVRFSETSVDIASGSAVVNTSNGMSVQSEGVKVAPAAKVAKFEVRDMETHLLVSALTGSVSVTDAHGTTVVNAGTSKSFDVDDDSNANNHPSKRKGGAAPAVGMHGGLVVKNGVVIGVAAAAAAAGVAYWATREDLSPSHP